MSGDRAIAATLCFRIRVRERMNTHPSNGYFRLRALTQLPLITTWVVLQPVIQNVPEQDVTQR